MMDTYTCLSNEVSCANNAEVHTSMSSPRPDPHYFSAARHKCCRRISDATEKTERGIREKPKEESRFDSIRYSLSLSRIAPDTSQTATSNSSPKNHKLCDITLFDGEDMTAPL